MQYLNHPPHLDDNRDMNCVNATVTTDRPRMRQGGIGLYAIVMLLVGFFFAIAFFFPQFFHMQSGIYRISCKEIRRKIEVAVTNYDANNTRSIVRPHEKIDRDALVASGFLAEVVDCPAGGKYYFGPKGEVLCSFHHQHPGPGDAELGDGTSGQ